MGETIVLPGRFRGPATTANGGYAAGAVAELVGGPATVLLRRPPPVDRELAVRRLPEGPVHVLDGDELVMVGEPAERPDAGLPDLDLAAVPWSEDVLAGLAGAHGAPTCIVCGPDRHDGMRIFPGVVREGVVACRWRVPEALDTRLWWAVLDCPGGWALVRPPGEPQPFFPALQRLAVDVRHPVEPGDEVVVLGWRTGQDGRKHHAATAVVTPDGRVLGLGRQTCVALPPEWALTG